VCDQQIVNDVHEDSTVRVQVNAELFDDVVLGQVIQHKLLLLVVNVNAVHTRVPALQPLHERRAK